MDNIESIEELYFESNKLNNSLTDCIDLLNESIYNPKTNALLDSLKDENNRKFKNNSEFLLNKIEKAKKEEKKEEKTEEKMV